MITLTATNFEQIAAACQAGLGETAEALSRALGVELQLVVDAPTPWDSTAVAGPGLIVYLDVGAESLAVVVPESSGLLPSDYTSSDPTTRSKLATLGQELSMLALPDSLMSETQRAIASTDVVAELAILGASAGTTSLVWRATAADGRQGAIVCLGPLKLATTSAAPAAAPISAPASPPPSSTTDNAAPPRIISTRSRSASLEALPPYTRSMLKIHVPVTVTLASKRQQVGKILELGIGSIIQFEKSCEEMLELEVGHEAIALGEPVKVGDKFGIRLTSMKLPPEKFNVVRGPKSGG